MTSTRWQVVMVAICSSNATHYNGLGLANADWWGWFIFISAIVYIVVTLIDPQEVRNERHA